MTTQPTPMHFPIDECAKCTVRGDMGGCLATRCSLHESWYARTQNARITELESQPAQRFDAADVATAAAQGFRDGVASAASWISVDERLPEPGNPVLLDIGKKYPIRALWAAKNTVRVGTDVDDWGEYDEETDEYYCPEGWYEWNEHEEVHWAVSETPRAWRELPPPLPAAHGPADGESNG